MIIVHLALVFGGIAVAAPAPIAIDPEFHGESLEGHLELLRDATGKLTLDDILSGQSNANFAALPSALALGYVTDVVWLRFKIAPTSNASKNLFLDLRPTFLDDVRIYSSSMAHPHAASDFSEIRLGDHIALYQRPSIATSLIAKINYPPEAESVVYIRIETTSTVALRGSIRAGGSIITSAALHGIQYGAFQGILLLMTLAHLAYGLRLRDKTYLAYGILLAVQSILLWCDNGMVPVGLLPGGGNSADMLTMIAVCLSHTVAAVFVSIQVDARHRFRWMHLVLMTIALLTGAALFASLAGYYKTVVPWVLASGVLIFTIALSCNMRLAWRRFPGSLFATFACLGQISGLTLTAMRLNGLVPYSIWTEDAFERGSLFFTLYMTIALAQRTSTAEEERRLAQQQALAVAQSAEQHAQALVAKRTRELANAKDLAEAALQAEHDAQQEQLRFIDVISHQYRTPLSVVGSSVSAIRQSLPSGDDANLVRIERIQKAISRLVDVIDVNLHRSRIDGATAHPDFRSLTVGPLVRDIVAQTRELSDNRTFDLRFEGDAEFSQIAADPEMLGLALQNLLENAQKFSASDTPIEILCRHDGDSLTVSVRDHGIGIPARERDLLAQKYTAPATAGRPSAWDLDFTSCGPSCTPMVET